MFSSSEYRILTPQLPTDYFGKLKLNLFNWSRSCPQEPLAEIQAAIGTNVFCIHWLNKESSMNLRATLQVLFLLWCLSRKSVILSKVWMTVKNFWKPKHASTWSFGNVQCRTLAPHTIPRRNRKDHLIVPLNSQENHPGSKMNHFPCSHPLCCFKITQVPSQHCFQKYFKAFLSPLALVWLYTNTDFLLCKAGKAVLHFPPGSMTPLRKNK